MKHVTLALALIVAGGAAQAATCTATFSDNGNSNVNAKGKSNGNGNGNGNGNSEKTVVYTLDQGNPDAVKKAGCFSGNDTNTIDAAWTFEGIKGWKLGDKVGDSGGGDGKVTFGTFPMGADFKWSVLNPMGYESIMVTLKQANSFAAFLLDTTKALSGTWFTKGPGDSEGALSHASVYYAGDKAPAPIPLPAGAALLPFGLAALAMLRRRKSR